MMAQCRKPSGLFGFFMTGSMNHGHAELTQWGLQAVSIGEDFTILDVGCGGRRHRPQAGKKGSARQGIRH